MERDRARRRRRQRARRHRARCGSPASTASRPGSDQRSGSQRCATLLFQQQHSRTAPGTATAATPPHVLRFAADYFDQLPRVETSTAYDPLTRVTAAVALLASGCTGGAGGGDQGGTGGGQGPGTGGASGGAAGERAAPQPAAPAAIPRREPAAARRGPRARRGGQATGTGGATGSAGPAADGRGGNHRRRGHAGTGAPGRGGTTGAAGAAGTTGTAGTRRHGRGRGGAAARPAPPARPAPAARPARPAIAFPGAQGFGKKATGARNGVVYHVTNLNDAGAGSFRDAVSASNRFVVFDVGGYIQLVTAVSVKSNITIAGQTAPGRRHRVPRRRDLVRQLVEHHHAATSASARAARPPAPRTTRSASTARAT